MLPDIARSSQSWPSDERAIRKMTLSSGDRKLVLTQDTGTCARQVTAGQTWRLSGYYKSDVPVKLKVYYRKTSGAWVY